MKHMHKQCVPGTLSLPPPPRLGTRLYQSYEYCFSVAIGMQLNAAPYLRGVQKRSPLPREKTMPAVLLNAQFPMYISLTPRPMIIVFGLGIRLHVQLRTRAEEGVLHNGQQPGNAVTIFIDQGKVEAMKLLSGC